MPTIPFHQFGIEAGGGAVAGVVIGYAAKKLLMLMAVVLGLELATFKFLEMRGFLEVNWGVLDMSPADVMEATVGIGQSPPAWMADFAMKLPLSTGVMIGFLIGFKRG